MKRPTTLVLICALVATPLFADTITLKSGKTYEGEILEKTSEYIRLKTESEVLRIEMSSIAKIETPEGEYGVDVKARPELHPDIVARAEAAAEAEVDKTLWFGAGCFLNVIGFIVASSVKPSPPESYLIGKSPEYVEAFLKAYELKAKDIQKEMAAIGCVVGSILACAATFLAIKAMLEDVGEKGCVLPKSTEPSGP